MSHLRLPKGHRHKPDPFNQHNGVFVQFFKIIRSKPLCPSKPSHCMSSFMESDIFKCFLLWGWCRQNTSCTPPIFLLCQGLCKGSLRVRYKISVWFEIARNLFALAALNPRLDALNSDLPSICFYPPFYLAVFAVCGKTSCRRLFSCRPRHNQSPSANNNCSYSLF